MRADLIAHTIITGKAMERHGFAPELGTSQMDNLAEFAGRACYQSFHRPNPATAENRAYLAHIIEVGHFSVLEHASVTFYITGISRSLTHELIRHRHFSYSQLSQRYVDESEAKTVVPPAYEVDGFEDLAEIVREAHDDAKQKYDVLVEGGDALGLSRKESRQAARAVLPNANETRIVVTGNMRAWRDFLKARWHVAADEEIKQLAGLLLEQLRMFAPGAVQDIPTVPYDYEPGLPTPGEVRATLFEAGLSELAVDVAMRALYPDSSS